MRFRWITVLLVFICLAISPAFAVQPDEIMADPTLEARARSLSAELRCLVCQNQSIDDSAAPLARDLRLLVRERLKDGDSDAQVKAFLVSRYGDFVLLKPPFEAQTLLLWGTPPLVLLVGAVALAFGRRRTASLQSVPLDSGERAKISALTGDQ